MQKSSKTKTKKILAIGDSLALPGHGNRYEDTWIYKLKQHYPQFDFITFFKRQLTTDVLVTMGGGADGPDKLPKGADCLEFYLPNIIILQLGIVDCAPRLLFDFERSLMNRLPERIASLYISIIKKVRKRNRNNTFVSLYSFEQNLNQYIKRALRLSVERVIIIGISYPDTRMSSKNMQITNNIIQYNSILQNLSVTFDFVKVIFPLDARNFSERIYEDGYHPNAYGNGIVFSSLTGILDDLE